MRAGSAVASFDSATGMLRALARFRRGRDVRVLGAVPGAEALALPVLGAANRTPRRVRELLYSAGGWSEASAARRLGDVRSEALARWVTGHYAPERAPVAFIGSSDGALVHLAAATGGPWLPQTLLLPVRRRGGHPDNAWADLRLLSGAAERLLDANPDLVLHHMHDPNQDRLMIAGMSYFRVKWRRLPAAYRDFLCATLPPGATLVVGECELRHPVLRVADRYIFQHGAVGGATSEEYQRGGPRVHDLLRRYGSPVRSFRAPEPDGEAPEAEWGFEPELLDDLAELARERRWRLVRMRYAEPGALSAPVADLHRHRYRARGIPDTRLLAESFLLMDPFWALRTGSVPYWCVFNTESSRAALNGYLDAAGPFEEIRLMLFAHGTESIGLAPIGAWQEVLDRATKVGSLLGADPRRFPLDLAVLGRAQRDLRRVRRTWPLPRPAPWREAEEFLDTREELALES
ncbi:hypothetical protein HDA32_003214 [Spinactinospora alkalitolerans]|uniref:Uncharacterized protein n=1 Tax=Spinactinospora alkalitolerans TaxID=687207 RepID=A0A852U1Q3_9ACTN|nr:hypothetical protein [Spinactinospora alkalitolerans]NYE48094.1 hypothetical protein [Spinactinospora alkalitolerans]